MFAPPRRLRYSNARRMSSNFAGISNPTAADDFQDAANTLMFPRLRWIGDCAGDDNLHRNARSPARPAARRGAMAGVAARALAVPAVADARPLPPLFHPSQ